MAEQRDGQGRHDAVRAAQDAWQSCATPDPGVLEAVQDGLLSVPAGSPTAWYGVPRPRHPRDQRAQSLHRRER
ncbi:hypothetical protein [Cellulomonas shaoxiangyii]|uniref:Uncharacterized protein n=1 Tax=Cellulomonas shaoxiangyii TaxID=2566013 RepID=A0A4V1CMA4_9CELL|nr:hypothetical protein [Cellulomonas shaoxiangyii]QCB92255.1 hypothetical protein E5225_00475 [Cellulomonas shaoxiangyii]TGY85933.1 hypothetical protein E5226_04460 [Cellulomonas shaoxiangyii]